MSAREILVLKSRATIAHHPRSQYKSAPCAIQKLAFDAHAQNYARNAVQLIR
jgi:hypothetical protein